MGFVIEGFLGLGLICLAVWGILAYLSAHRDKADSERCVREADLQRRHIEEDAELLQSQGPLRCMACDHTFDGPLDDSGCPICHTSSLVITEIKYRQQTKPNN